VAFFCIYILHQIRKMHTIATDDPIVWCLSVTCLFGWRHGVTVSGSDQRS